MSELLAVRDLAVDFRLAGSTVQAVKGVSFDIGRARPWRWSARVGSGKSVTALSILQLLPYPVADHPERQHPLRRRRAGRAPTRRPLRQVRGDRIAMIFQEPMTSLNPLHTHRAADRRDPAAAQGHDPPRPRASGRSNCCGWSGLPEAEKRLAPIRMSCPAASASAS